MIDTLLAQLIAKREGFYVKGSVPNRDNNPGDLRHSPHSQHPGDANAIGQIDTVSDGWADLERQLTRDSARGYTLKQLIEGTPDPVTGELVDGWAPASDGNDPNAYLNYLCAAGGWTSSTLVSDALKVQGSLT